MMNSETEDLIRLLCKGPSAKATWKKLWRMLRVHRRETLRATHDLILYGAGCVMIPDGGGDPCRVHPRDVKIELPDNDET